MEDREFQSEKQTTRVLQSFPRFKRLGRRRQSATTHAANSQLTDALDHFRGESGHHQSNYTYILYRVVHTDSSMIAVPCIHTGHGNCLFRVPTFTRTVGINKSKLSTFRLEYSVIHFVSKLQHPPPSNIYNCQTYNPI